MKKIALLLGVHAHQPVGNFAQVIEEAHLRCYQPFLRMLANYPQFRFSAHFSGWLLDELQRRYPQDMALLAEMVARGQAELFGAGDYEPVLAAIPHRDRVAQIDALSARLERGYGQRPIGAWLTERVWESSIVPALVAAGIRYVAVDDYHFLASGKLQSQLDGYYCTEEGGERIDLFPISEALRYRFPFAPAHEAVGYLESLADAGQAAATYFDDIEKFGIWPETYEWVYNQGWLRQFIERVLASDKIATMTYREFHAGQATRGIVYLPTTSYIEMNEWTLGTGAAEHYMQLVRDETARNRYASTKAFVRGGIWRNFLSRYREANWMHKRMLGLSARLDALPKRERTAAMQEWLHRAQANDAYWHGLFGGLYLPHLRRAVWQSIVQLERALDAHAPRRFPVQDDIDCDGIDELFIGDAAMQAVTRLDGLAALCELDSYRLGHNFGDTLRRIDEPYYAQIFAAPSEHAGAGIASAHDRVALKQPIAPADIVADAHPRAMFIDALVADQNTREVIDDYALAATAGGRLRWRSGRAGGVHKTLCLEDGAVVIIYDFEQPTHAVFVTTLNFAMPSCDGYGGRYILADGSIPCGFGQPLTLDAMQTISLDDRELGGALCIRSSHAVRFDALPHHAVSRSEGGFEKIMQAVCVQLSWTLDAAHEQVRIHVRVVTDPPREGR